jgi:hypothetical protein
MDRPRIRHAGRDDLRLVARVFRPQAVDAYPRAALLYYPFLPTAKELPASMFEAGEVAEFQQKDFAKAIAFFVNCPNRKTRQSVLDRSFASVAIFAKHNSPEQP